MRQEHAGRGVLVKEYYVVRLLPGCSSGNGTGHNFNKDSKPKELKFVDAANPVRPLSRVAVDRELTHESPFYPKLSRY
jgi:hypothetical protein